MTVKDGEAGDVVISSFNGGDWRSIKDECRDVGLLPRREQRPDHAAWRDVARFEYCDTGGNVLYRTVRREKPGEKKRFVAQRLVDGRWVAGLDHVTRVPYRLPELLAADPVEPVYFVEGEGKADRLARDGMVATAIAFGANGWRDEYAQHFADRTVIILPDNDEPGRAFANRVSESLAAMGATTAIVPLGGSTGDDVIDWMARGGSACELGQKALEALSEPVPTFDIADLSAWARVPPMAKAFYMAPFIPSQDVVIITGDGGTNKSTLALQISACSAVGKPMLGIEVAEGSALYLTAEDDDRENHWRLTKIATALGTTIDQMVGRLHIVSLRGRLNNEIATFDHDGTLRPAAAYTLLRATIEKTGAKLVTLDNVAHLYAGNENDRSQVTAFINLLYQLCGDLGVTILLIAHRNKVGDSYSGSTAWLNAVRSQILLERGEDGDPDVRKLSLGKANYARPGEELSFRWHDFALVRDCDLPTNQRDELAAVGRAYRDNGIFLDCLRERAKQGEARMVGPSPGSNYAPAQFDGMPQAKGLKKAQFKVVMDRLFATGAIETYLFKNLKGSTVTLIREVPTGPRTAAPNASRTPFPNDPEQSSRTTPTTPPIYKYIPGAATEAAAPVTGHPVDRSRDERLRSVQGGAADADDGHWLADDDR